MRIRIAFPHIDDGPRPLEPDDLHIWSAPLTRCCDADLLIPDERARASRFKMERIRLQFIASRVQLRIILGRYLNLAPEAVPITYESNGKPMLHPSCGADLHFNVTHSEGLAIYAVTQAGRVGVDVELSREIPNVEGLVERFFTANDRTLFQNLPPCEHRSAFLHAWTRKEAVLKAVGLGVPSIERCEVTFCPGVPEAVLQVGDDFNCSAKWLLRSWQPEEKYVAAVAVELGGASEKAMM